MHLILNQHVCKYYSETPTVWHFSMQLIFLGNMNSSCINTISTKISPVEKEKHFFLNFCHKSVSGQTPSGLYCSPDGMLFGWFVGILTLASTAFRSVCWGTAWTWCSSWMCPGGPCGPPGASSHWMILHRVNICK